jgi:predicted AlkP superfamily phosphohydrolase/phosphomutase
MVARLLIVGLDGADPGLLARWTADGSLPAIRALQSRGRCGDLSTPGGLGDDAAWPCFYTGEDVGAHGRYFWRQLTPDSPRLELARGRLPVLPPFWSRLGPERAVAVIDVPKIPLTRGFNGIQLCDWLVHGRDYEQPVSYPADLARHIVDEFGAAPVSVCDETSPHLEKEAIEAMADRLCRSAAMKLDATCRLLAESEWHLFVAVFKEAHCASHMLWHLVDPAHPDYRPEAGHDGPVRRVYHALDRAVGDIVERAGPETSILLFTPLGMGVNVTGNHLMPALAQAINRANLRPFARPAIAAIEAIRPSRIGRLPYSLCRVMPHNEISGALRLNVKGRDPRGAIEPGEPCRALCGQLAADLGELRDAETGRRIVDRVLLSQDSFPGAASGMLPDLFIVWSRNGPIGEALSPRYGHIRARPDEDMRPGNHVPGGRYILAGPAAARWHTGDTDIRYLARLFLEAAGSAHAL